MAARLAARLLVILVAGCTPDTASAPDAEIPIDAQLGTVVPEVWRGNFALTWIGADECPSDIHALGLPYWSDEDPTVATWHLGSWEHSSHAPIVGVYEAQGEAGSGYVVIGPSTGDVVVTVDRLDMEHRGYGIAMTATGVTVSGCPGTYNLQGWHSLGT